MLAGIKMLAVYLLPIIPAIAVDPATSLAEGNTFQIYGDTDAPGFDHQAFDPPSLDSCKNQCGEDHQCKAFTYNHAKQVCFLKHGVSVTLQRHRQATTGLKIGTNRFSMRKSRDAPGRDYRQLVPPTFARCRSVCDGDPNCKSFTYNEAKRICFLKLGAPETDNPLGETILAPVAARRLPPLRGCENPL